MSDQHLHKGDRVKFSVGKAIFRARVVEDRGALGVGGRQLVRIELLPDDDTDGEPRRFEMPADELTRDQTAA